MKFATARYAYNRAVWPLISQIRLPNLKNLL